VAIKPSFNERVEELKKHAGNQALLKILDYTFNKNYKFLLPEGTPPYKPNEYVDQTSNLYQEVRRIYLFLEGGNPNLRQHKREALFIQLLETVDKDDAKILIAMKDHKSPLPNITDKLVKTAFPDLIK